MALIYKVVSRALWERAQGKGHLTGAPVDLADGYIHFSTAGQLVETVAKHFRGQDDLVLLAVDDAGLGEALVYEPSRGGALFPHLYAPLPASAVLWTKTLPMRSDGTHELPDLAG